MGPFSTPCLPRLSLSECACGPCHLAHGRAAGWEQQKAAKPILQQGIGRYWELLFCSVHMTGD